MLTPELDSRDAEAGGTVVWMEKLGKEEEALCSSVSVFHFQQLLTAPFLCLKHGIRLNRMPR